MTEHTRRFLLGTLLCLATAASFATNSTLASLAYADGASPLSVLTYRTILSAGVLAAILKVHGVSMRLPPRERWISLGLGLMLAAYSYGLFGAIQYMPVALAVLTFYMFPLLLGFASWAIGAERMTPSLLIALIVAFTGLALALDVGGHGLSLAGFALAGSAAVIVTILMLINSRLVGGRDSRPVSLHMLSAAAAAYVVIDLIAGRFPLPATPGGWATFVAVGGFYTFSIISLFIAVSWIGPVRAALVMNFEPISSVVLGIVVLGQILKPGQFAGAALVIAAIVFTAWRKLAETRAQAPRLDEAPPG